MHLFQLVTVEIKRLSVGWYVGKKKNIIRVSFGDLAKKTDNVGTPPLVRWKLS